MPDHPRLRLDDQLCFALYTAMNGVIRAYRPLLAHIGLTYPQYLLMMALWEHGDLSLSDLGQCADVPANSVTPMVRRLAGAGLVRRAEDASDARVVRVHLTAAGVRLERRAAEVQNAVVDRTGLSASSLVSLRSTLRQLASATSGTGRSASAVMP